MRTRRTLMMGLAAALAMSGPLLAFSVSVEGSCGAVDVYSYRFSDSMFPDFEVKVSDSEMFPDLTIKLVPSPRLADLVVVDADREAGINPDIRVCRSSSEFSGVSIKVTSSSMFPDINVKLSRTAPIPDHTLYVESDRLSPSEAAALFAVIWAKNRAAGGSTESALGAKGEAVQLYRAVTHPAGFGGLPDYEIRDKQFFRTVSHPLGWSGLPDYEIRTDRKIYRTVSHPAGWGGLPDYEFRQDGKIYRTVSHPAGWGGLPDYEVRK